VTTPVELVATLTQLVALAHRERLAMPWEQPDADAFMEQLAATFFILDRQDDGADVAVFIGDQLELLAAQLRRTTRVRTQELQGRVRGMIDWPATAVRRLGRDDATIFVCRDTEFYYDTPENQLLFFLLEQIERSVTLIPAHVQAGITFGPAEQISRTAPQLARVVDGVRRFRRATAAVRVPLPRAIGHEQLARAERSPLAGYRVARHVLLRWEQIAARPSWPALLEASRRVLPVPLSTNPHDPWLQFAAGVLGRHPATSGRPS
jgi:hypothetical protein